MRKAFCVLCLLSTAVARGQAPSSNSAAPTSTRPHQIQSANQAKHVNSASASAHGEKAHTEAMPQKAEVPLGDTARTLKKKHATAKKARTVFEN